LILIALGSNLPSEHGTPLQTLEAAIARIDAHDDISVVSCSPVYKSAPVPISDQPWYHNAVIAVNAELKPFTLLATLQEIEMQFGRERDAGNQNAARTLDLDIVGYHGQVVDEGGLTVPHPRMAERAFVLMPLYDVAPEWIHPVTGASIGEMLEALPEGQALHKIEGGEHDAA